MQTGLEKLHINYFERLTLTYLTAQQCVLYLSPQGSLFSLLLVFYYTMSWHRLALN